MRLTPAKPEGPADERLDPCRGAIARLFQDGKPVAYLATRVETWWTAESGYLWWTRWSDPEEKVEWLLSNTGGAELPSWDDGPDQPVEELEAGWFTYPNKAGTANVVYEIRWLGGDEASAAWAKWSWDAPPVSRSDGDS